MQLLEKKIPSAFGAELELTIRVPNEGAKGVIQINTGTCIPQRIYRKFAEYMTRQGYITITYDYSDAQQFKSAVSHLDWYKDMASVFNYILATYPDLKKIMVGHSSGGQFIGTIANADQIDEIYLVAASNGYWRTMNFPFKYAMWLFWKLLLPYSIRKYGYMNNKIYGVSGGFPKNIALELRSFCMQPDFFLPFLRENKVAEYYKTVTAKVVAYHLQGDQLANKNACRYILDLYSNAQSSFVSLRAKDFGMPAFGHRDFFAAKAEKLLWPMFLNEIEGKV